MARPGASHWSRAIQNESYVPPPTPYSPQAARDEDPLVEQERHCRDKLQALRSVRARFRFQRRVCVSSEMVLSAAEAAWRRDEAQDEPRGAVDALGGLEALLFEFLSCRELVAAAQTCRHWQRLARLDLFWEPRLVSPLERYPLRELLGLARHVPAIQVYMMFRRMKLAQAPFVEPVGGAATASAWPAATRRPADRRRALVNLLQSRANERDERLQRLLEMELRVHAPDAEEAPVTDAGNDDDRERQLSALANDNLVDMETVDDLELDQMASVHLITIRRTQSDTLSAPCAATPLETPLPAAGADVPEGHLQQLFDDLLTEPEANLAHNQQQQQQQPQQQQQAQTQQQNRRPGGATVVEEEDVFSVVDGRDRIHMGTWLANRKKVSETTLRSFIRQMLLAVRALKAAQIEHINISMANIVVVQNCNSPSNFNNPVEAMSQGASTTPTAQSAAESHSPLFQLFFSRRNVRSYADRPLDTNLEYMMPPLGLEAGIEREIMLDVDMVEPRPDDGGIPNAAALLEGIAQGRGVGAAPRGGIGLFPRVVTGFPMLQAVLNCVIQVWAHGRFTDPNILSHLTVLLRHPSDVTRGLRSFLEYAKFLLMTNALSVEQLLQHEFISPVMEPDSNIVRYTDWDTNSFRDVAEYRSRVLAWYRNATNSGMVDVSAPVPANNRLLSDELTPKTTLGTAYLSRALEECGLSSDRFVSVVAPSNATSSWIKALAGTQSATLQRLDLSCVHVPPSVVLKELAMLPRITHLCLPSQFLRDENLEHLIAALEYADLLPSLRVAEETVRVAMDRLEKSYVMQLDMVTFLLQKPAPSPPQ